MTKLLITYKTVKQYNHKLKIEIKRNMKIREENLDSCADFFTHVQVFFVKNRDENI